MSKRIYYINRYDLHKPKGVKDYSGYEQIVNYYDFFEHIRVKPKLSRYLLKFIKKKYLPKSYLKVSISKEFIVFFKALWTGNPVFYLYADKDAFLLPLLKRRLGLKRIKLYGTLHWPKEISSAYSFYRYDLLPEFNGIITLSNSLKGNSEKFKVLPHGIDLQFWKPSKKSIKSIYLLIGMSNRDHEGQAKTIEHILSIDPESEFVLLCQDKKAYSYYEGISNMTIHKEWISDYELKSYYEKAKAVILMQNYCLASNVVLESMAMGVPIVANRIGDIAEYLGSDYPLYYNLSDNKNHERLMAFCNDTEFRESIASYLLKRSKEFEWQEIAENTVNYILG